MAIIELTPARIGVQVQNPPQARGGVSPQAMAAPGEAIAQLGRTFGELEERARQARNQRELMIAGAEYAEGLAELRGRAERNDPEFAGDPVAAFRTGSERLRATIASRFTDNDLRGAFEARSLVAAAGEVPAMITFATRREAERTQAALTDTLATYARGASSETDPALRRRRVEGADEAIAGALATGAISETQAQRLRTAFLGNLDQADVLRLINTNPGEAARALANPERFANLDPVQRERLFGTAQNAAQAAAARADAAVARRERAVAVEVQQFNGLLQAGVVPEERVARVLDMARGTALEPQVRQMVEDGRAVAAFSLASNDEQLRLLGEADARRRGANATDADAAQYARLAQVRQAQLTAYQQDGLGRAVAEGLVPPQPPIDWTNPATLNSRVEAAAGVSERRGYAISPFNRDDLAAGVQAFTSGSPDQRLAIVQAVASISDPQVRAAAIQHFERARGDAGRLPAGTLVRVADMLRAGTVETQQAARRVLADLTADVSDRAKQIGEGTEMRSALVTAQESGVQRVRVRQAEIAGGGPYAAQVSRDMDVIARAAAARLVSGESSVTRAVEATQAAWNAGLGVVDDSSLAHVYFPAARATPAQVTIGLRLLRDQTAGAAVDPGLGADQALAARTRQEAARRAVWINEGGTFALVSRGQAGAPVVLRTATLDEVTRAAEGEAARDAARPPVMRRDDAGAAARREIVAPPPQPDRPQRQQPRLQ